MTNVRKWRKTEKDSLENGLFLYDEKSYLLALPIFENIYNNHPSEEFIKYVYAKCGLYRSDKHEDAYMILSEIYQKNKKVEDIQYDLALAAHYNNKFDEALDDINAYLLTKHLLPENRKKAEALKRFISNGKYYSSNPTMAKVTDLGSAINSPDDEYTPAIKADESAMIFTYVGPKSIGGKQNIYLQPDPNGVYMEDVYMSYKLSNEFTTAFPLDSLNTNAPDASISLSNDGSILFIYKNENDNHGDIYQSELIGEHYTKPKRLKGQVNSYAWDGHCSLSPDGKTLYFSSERGGGIGGRDIYKASLSEDGSWQHVVNLGDTINTPLDEDAPFIHPDGVSLFYSSNGRKSMGGYDVFKATMNTADSTFKKSESLGYPINSTDDDIYFVMSANSETAYYSSGRKGGKGLKDIYQIETNFSGPKPSLYLVKGEIQYDGDEVAATIKVEMTSKNNKAYGTFLSNSNNGSYLISLPAGESYKLTYSYKELPVKTLDIDLIGITGYSEKNYNVDFKDTPEPVAPSVAAITPTVKTELAKTGTESTTNAEAKAEAERIAKEKAAAKAATDAEARAEAARIAKEKAATDAEARAETARIAKEKATADAEARAETARIAKEKATADAEARAEAARIAKEKVTADAEARAEAARIAKEKATADAEARAEAARIAKEKATADAAARAELAAKKATERAAAKAEADRIAKETPKPIVKPVATKTVSPEKQAAEEEAENFKAGKDGFVPRTKLHEKAIRYIEKFGDIKTEGLEFKVQITAFKTERNQAFPQLRKYGKIERVKLGDGFTRLYIGGSFKTLRTAFALTKRVVLAGQTDAFVSAFYKGKRLTYEELERSGIFISAKEKKLFK
jgi:hypothetical protein